jgi:hypothetical protein
MPHVYQWICANAGSYMCQAFAPSNFANWIQVLIGLAGLLGLLVGFILTRRTLKEMTRQGDTLYRQMESSDRPWLQLAIGGPIPRFKRENGCVYWPSIFVVSNVGTSVATDITVAVMLAPFNYGPGYKASDTIPLKLNAMRSRAAGMAHLSHTVVFPGESSEIRSLTEIAEETVRNARVIAPDDVPQHVFFELFACARYRYGTSDRDHFTTIGYIIGARDGDVQSPEYGFPLPIDTIADVREENILLLPHIGAFTAD